ncbi:MAG: CoA-transferase, partial [Acidimicrobiales bacterium]
QATMGAHPGGLFVRGLPVEPYGEDLEFWAETRDASRSDDFDSWINHWVREPATQAEYLERLGGPRIARLRHRAEPDSWREDEAANPPDFDRPIGAWERAAAYGARYVVDRISLRQADAVLAGAGVANLAAWLAVDLARTAGADVVLTAELGLWGYEPTPADPFVFNHRSFPSATMMGDSEQVLGALVGGPGTDVIGCLGAAQIDMHGNINSTAIPGKAFLVGSGGGNDVASAAGENVVVATLTPRRTVADVPYITSPGERIHALVTDLGTFEKNGEGRFVLRAIAPGNGTVEERVEAIRDLVGWELAVDNEMTELAPVDHADIEALRRWDPLGRFLRPD